MKAQQSTRTPRGVLTPTALGATIVLLLTSMFQNRQRTNRLSHLQLAQLKTRGELVLLTLIPISEPTRPLIIPSTFFVFL